MTYRRWVVRLAAIAGIACSVGCQAATPTDSGSYVKIKMSGREVSVIPSLTLALGNFQKEGLDVTLVSVDDYPPPDYQMQEALNKGLIDVSVHWFQHTIYGAAHNQPVRAVILLNDAPGVTVLVANRVKDQIRTAADFRGRNIAEGAGYATKSMLMNLLAAHAGLAPGSYTPVATEFEGRQAAVIKGLNEGKVDVMAFMEPMTSALKTTGQVTALYELTSRESTTRALGAPWPAQSVFFASSYVREHPDRVQRIVNAFVRTMRFVNTHSAEEIADRLPPAYFAGKDRQVEIAKIRNTFSTYAKGDYSFSPPMVKLAVASVRGAPFDDSDEGKFRTRAKTARFKNEDLYDNEFVEKAIKAIP